MCEDENIKVQKQMFFIGIILAIICGVSGNLLVTSFFETLHYYEINEISSIPIAVITLCVSAL